MSEWISVKDRLPNPLDEVLVHDIEGKTLISYLFIGKPKWYGGFNVTYWMPLPNPPKENK